MKCPICQNNYTTPSGIDLYRCPACSHLFRNLPASEQEPYGEHYFSQAHKNWFSHPNYGLFKFAYRQIIKRMGSRELKLIDIGCGRGDFLKYLASKHSRIDLSGIDLTYNQYPNINFIKGDFMKYPISGKFDVVSTFAVIEHIDCLYPFVQKIYDVLSTDGLLLVMAINSQGLPYKIAQLLKRIGISSAYRQLFNKRHHLNFFTSESLELFMEKSGFEIVSTLDHSYPLRAVDFPETNSFKRILYLCGVGLTFLLSAILERSILQTIICKKCVGYSR